MRTEYEIAGPMPFKTHCTLLFLLRKFKVIPILAVKV